MKKSMLFMAGASVISLSLLSSCIDDKYDLSDIDTTTKINVNDLTIPVNIDEIYIKNLIKTDGTEVKIIDGKYCVSKIGEFNSDEILFKSVNFDPPKLTASRDGISTSGMGNEILTNGSASLELTTTPVHFQYYSPMISKDIDDIESIDADFSITIKLDFEGFGNCLTGCTYNNLSLRIPKGLTLVKSNEYQSYDAKTGALEVGNRKSNHGATGLYFTIYATSIDNSAGYSLNENHDLIFDDDLAILSGDVMVTKADLSSAAVSNPSLLPTSVTFVTDYDLSEIKISKFTGTVHYSISGMELPNVNLSNIPGALKQEGTDLILENPQIYLSLNNPVASYGLKPTSGMSIEQVRDGKAGRKFEIAPGTITLSVDVDNNTVQNFCLANTEPENYLEDFANSKWVKFSDLNFIVSGTSIPERLNVNLLNPSVDKTHVKDLPLGVSLGKVTGKYEFYAPFDLEEGSVIRYSDTLDGWGSDDLDDMTITELHITAEISSDIPGNITITGYPIDRDGKQIGNVEIKGADLKAYSQNVPIDIYITGEIRRLDGIVLVAVIDATGGETVAENMSIVAKKIRATVSGYYIRKL